MKSYKILLAGTVLGIAATFSSCDLLDREPNIITEDQFYTSSEQAQLGLNAVYGVMNSWQLYGCTLILDLGYNTDISMYMSSNNSDMYGASFELNANSASVSNPWIWLYKGIGNANAFLEKFQVLIWILTVQCAPRRDSFAHTIISFWLKTGWMCL